VSSPILNLFGEEVASTKLITREVLAVVLERALAHISLREFALMLTNEVESALEFARLCDGEDVGQKISLCFNPHRLNTTAGGNPSMFGSLRSPGFCSGLARALAFDGFPKDELYKVLRLNVNGAQYVNEFPPHLCRDLLIRDGVVGWWG
jgi:hypothetical protein